MKTMDVRRDSGTGNSEADRVQGEMTAVTAQMPQTSAGNPERPRTSMKSQTEKSQHPARMEQMNLTPNALSASPYTSEASVSHWPPILHRDNRDYINYEEPGKHAAAHRAFPNSGDFLTNLELAKTNMGNEWKLPTAMNHPLAPPPFHSMSMRNGVPMNNTGAMIHARQEPSSSARRTFAIGSENPRANNYQHHQGQPTTVTLTPPLPPSVEHQTNRTLDRMNLFMSPETSPAYKQLNPYQAQFIRHRQLLSQQRYHPYQYGMQGYPQLPSQHQLTTPPHTVNQQHVLEQQQRRRLAHIQQKQQQQQQQQQDNQPERDQREQETKKQHKRKQMRQHQQQQQQQQQLQRHQLEPQQQGLYEQKQQQIAMANHQQQQQQQQQHQQQIMHQEQEQQQSVCQQQYYYQQQQQQLPQQQQWIPQQGHPYLLHPQQQQHHQHQEFMEYQRRILIEREANNMHPHAILPYGHLHQYQPLLPRPKPFEKAMLAKQNLAPKTRKRRSADAAVPSKAKKGKKQASPTSSTPSQMPTPSTPSQMLTPSTSSQTPSPSSSSQTPTSPSQEPSPIEGIATYASPSSQPDTFVVDLRNMATKEITSIVHHKPSVPSPSPAIGKENCHPGQRESATTNTPPASVEMPAVIESLVSSDTKKQGPDTIPSSVFPEDVMKDIECLWDLFPLR